jgi:ADP-ribosylglycohydrolase/fructose-1,6-bisphosphatase/inositol monophosphatase family enzyme
VTDELAGPRAVAIEAALEAGAMVRREFHRTGGPRGYGGHADVDEEAERVIRVRLQQAFPDWGYRGEETGSAGVEPNPRYLWLVDPNDGTVSFLQGVRGSSVSIALLRDRQPVLGVVYAPCAPDDDGDLVVWADGQGPVTRNGVPVARPPWPQDLGSADVVLVSYDMDRDPWINAQVVAPARYRAINSIAYRLALAAVGEATLATSLKGAGDWDYAGGQALLRATDADLFGHDGAVVAYTGRGESRSQACFGGAPAVIPDAIARPWREIYRHHPSLGGRPDNRPPDGAGRHLRRARPRRGEAIADAALLRRVHGCLLGQLAGDALGSLVEFEPPHAIAARYPDGVRELANGGAYGTIAGQPTDDSEMALMLARSIVASGRYDPELTVQAYGYWYRSGPFDIGATTSRALAPTGAAASHLDAALVAAVRSAADAISQSNGSLMRVSPLGIFGSALDPDVLADLARSDSVLTHPNPICQEACAVYVVAIAHAVASGDSPQQVYRFALDWARRALREEAVLEALLAAGSEPPADFVRNQGWVLVALQNAFYRLLHAPSAAEGIIATATCGGDTDTNAAIAGALLGAVHGRESLPQGWRNLVLSCRPVDGAPGVRRPRPAAFWPIDALELAELLLLAGSS